MCLENGSKEKTVFCFAAWKIAGIQFFTVILSDNRKISAFQIAGIQFFTVILSDNRKISAFQ